MASAHPVNTEGSEQHQAVRYLAHVRQDEETFIPHDLEEHLRSVRTQVVETSL